MEWFIAAVAVAALGVAAVAAAGGVGEMSSEPVYDTYRQDLPEAPLTAADLEKVRFGVALRGYAMAQVDDLLERLGREIAERDARIAELTGGGTALDPATTPGEPVLNRVPAPLTPPEGPGDAEPHREGGGHHRVGQP